MIFLMDWCRSLGHSVTDSIDKMNGIVAKKNTTRERAYCPMHKNTEECDRKRERKREIWKHRKFIAVDGIQSILILLNFYETKIIITDCEIVRFETDSNNELKTGNDKFCVIVKWTEFIVEARMRQFACNFQLGKSKQTLFIDCNRILSSGDEHRENALKFGLERRIGYGEGCDGRVAMATAITYCEWKAIFFFYILQGEISKWTK